jgi:hypothetical protein
MLAAALMLWLGVQTGAQATPPPAGTSIGNQASVTYTDSSGTSRTVTSNTVQTVVQQVASLTLTANGAKTSSIGSTVYYPHTLTNTGNGTDTFGLTAVNAAGSAFNMTGVTIYAITDPACRRARPSPRAALSPPGRPSSSSSRRRFPPPPRPVRRTASR